MARELKRAENAEVVSRVFSKTAPALDALLQLEPEKRPADLEVLFDAKERVRKARLRVQVSAGFVSPSPVRSIHFEADHC